MSISTFRNNKPPAVVVSASGFWISRPETLHAGSNIVFEVLESNVGSLEELVGRDEYFVLDANTHFHGRLQSLAPCSSTHQGLARMRERATLRGVISVSRGNDPVH